MLKDIRIFTNVLKQVYPDIEKIHLPLLRNDQFSLKVVVPDGPFVDRRVNIVLNNNILTPIFEGYYIGGARNLYECLEAGVPRY